MFKEYKIILLGDREFCSIKLANWLREQELMFCLRLKKNEFIEIEDDVWQELNQDMSVSEAEVEIGLGFEVEGNIFIAKGKTNASLTIRLKLKPK